MKRLRVDETVKEISGPQLTGNLYRQTLPNTASAISYAAAAAAGAVKVVSEGMQSTLYPSSAAPPVSYGVMPAAAAPHSGKPQAMQPLTVSNHAQMRAQGASPPSSGPPPEQQQQQQQSPGNNFQRLKVEDALSYLDLVKYKFGSKPQVYNDFLDIMKEFKSQSIDTPGVIQRVSSLFKGFPDLIVGFNTFLPPGYKIEVQRNDQGYAFQVSVSMPSPTGGGVSSSDSGGQQKSAMIFKGTGTINTSVGGVGMGLGAGPPLQPAPPVVPQVQPVVAAAAAAALHPPTYASGAPMQQQVQAQAQQQQQQQHNSAVSAAGALTLSAAAVSQALQGHTDAPQNQPVEFNHAINYVNKIKNRFQGQPEKYKRFLEILHTYQKEQRTLKESSQGQGGAGKHLTEQEVYSQVAKLFEHQSDLLAEFGQFLPDASNSVATSSILDHRESLAKKQPQKPYRDHVMDRHLSHKPGHVSSQLKRSPPYSSLLHRDAPPPKKHKMSSSCRDVTLAEAGKYGSLNDYAFFDKVRKALRSQDVYNNFLRCLTLFNQEVISKTELVQLATPFLGKFPELMRWFRDFLGQGDCEPIAYNSSRIERPQGDHALELDLSTAKRLGASYCVIPPAQEGQRCSGRTALCREVLNDQWVSFPTWSEDSTFVSSRKTQYEEHMYRCEDERFELDVVIETNAATIRVLEGVQKKMNRMNPEDVARYRLDECLGGSSPVLHQRALKRIYGEKAQDIIDGLMRNPAVAVPVVLRRLKAKEEEWREAQKGFNKIWREQNEKYYLKSLDHQGINFKQNDVKALRSKSLFNEIEAIFDEQHEQNDENGEPVSGPHLVLPYKDRTILDDATNLLMHHVKRQTGVQKGEKRRIKQILCHFIPDLFFHPRQQLSDDEREEDDEKEEGDVSPKSNSSSGDNYKSKPSSNVSKSPARASEPDTIDDNPDFVDIKEEDVKTPLHAQCSEPDEEYTLFFANNNWYIFLRLHAILCERLAKIYERTIALAKEEAEMRKTRKESTAVALRLKPKPQIEVENYYTAFLEIVKNLLDGNMEPNAYEDTLREMFGIHAYIAFTLDKVVQYAVRQLQHCVTERTAHACTKLFHREQKRGAAGGACGTAHRRIHLELGYQRGAEKAVQDENCFKIFIYKNTCRMSVELLDTESEDSKKVEDAKKWSVYKECYSDITNTDGGKQRSPVYLNRNLRGNKLLVGHNKSRKSCEQNNEELRKQQQQQQQQQQSGGDNDTNSNKGNNVRSESERGLMALEELEQKLSRPLPERSVTEHPGYDVADETQCKFNSNTSKVMFTVNKDSYLYKHSAFSRAKKTHPEVTRRLASKFRSWLKKWCAENVSDVQQKQCTDWLMGRGDGVVPNRTRVVTDNDITRTPYAPYSRYRVERLSTDST